MRVSTEKDDVAYIGGTGRAINYRIMLNGEWLKYCVTADTDRGMVRYHKPLNEYHAVSVMQMKDVIKPEHHLLSIDWDAIAVFEEYGDVVISLAEQKGALNASY